MAVGRISRLKVVVLVLLSLGAWPAAGHAQADLVVDPGWHDFGSLAAGEAASGVLEVWNDGSEPLTLGRIGFEGAAGPFALGGDGCVADLVLESGWGCDLAVTFVAPPTRGDHEAVVVVEADGGTKVALGRLTGSSYVPGHLVAAPGALEFGLVPRGSTSPPQSVVIRNAGDTTLVFSSLVPVSTSGRDARAFDLMAGQCVGELVSGAACEITVALSLNPFPIHIGGRPFIPPLTAAESVVEASIRFRVQGGAVALVVPIRGTVAGIAPPPRPPAIDYGFIEEDLVRLAERVPRLARGGRRPVVRLPSFTAPTAGRLSLWVRGAGHQRRMLLGVGALKLEGGRSGRLRLSLTRKARKLLQRPRKTSVKVMVAFKAGATGETFKQALELTVRRAAKKTTRRPAKRRR
jgi:hypothetical protein